MSGPKGPYALKHLPDVFEAVRICLISQGFRESWKNLEMQCGPQVHSETVQTCNCVPETRPASHSHMCPQSNCRLIITMHTSTANQEDAPTAGARRHSLEPPGLG